MHACKTDCRVLMERLQKLKLVMGVTSERQGSSTYEGLIRGTDRVVVSTQVLRCSKVHAANGDAELFGDVDPVGSGFRVCIGVVCYSVERQ